MRNARFSSGRIIATPGALEALDEAGQNPATLTQRYQSGDRDDCCKGNTKENVLSVCEGFRISSVCQTSNGQKIGANTEADQSSTGTQ